MFGYSSGEDSDLDPEHEGDTRMYFGRLMPKEWKFLYNWFEELTYRVYIAERRRMDTHAVALGRDVENDLWIEIEHEDTGQASKFDTLADDSVKRYKFIREMILLTTILSEVNYDVWYAELRRGARFTAPKYIDLKHNQLPRKFVFAFYESENPADCSWDLLQHAFSHDNFSEEFTEQFPQACDAAKKHGFDVATMKPIPIKFVVRPHTNDKRAEQVAIIKNLTKTVLKILELEAKRGSVETATTAATGAAKTGRAAGKTKAKAGEVLPPVFHLECVDLDFRQFSYHTTVVAEIKKLVETGVPIVSLTLPRRGVSNSKETDEKQKLVWASFLCTITGQPQVPPPTTAKKAAACRPAQVQRIVLSPVYPMELFTTMLCSALATSRGVKAVRINHDILSRKYGMKTKWKNYAWLAYALFSEHSQSSVESLELGQHGPTPDEMTAFAKTIQSSDPLAALWQLTTATDPGEASLNVRSVNKPVSVAKGTTLYPLSHALEEVAVVLPNDWSGTLVSDDRSSSTVDVLLPGFGLCRVDRASIPNKRQRPSSPLSTSTAQATTARVSKVTQLVLGFRLITKKRFFMRRSKYDSEEEPIKAMPFMTRFVELVGAPLTALSLEGDDVDQASVDACLRHCPKLRSLRLAGVSLKTMAPLIEAYRRGAKINSLEMRDIKDISGKEFEKLLAHLLIENGKDPIQVNLKKLRIGRGWAQLLRPETGKMLEDILASDGCRISYIHTFNSLDSVDPRWRFYTKDWRGKLIEDKSSAEELRVGFLSVAQPQAPITSHLIAIDEYDMDSSFEGDEDEW